MLGVGARELTELGNQRSQLFDVRMREHQPCLRFVQVATDGGLLPAPLVRDAFELWPAKRREMVVDFTRYLDGSPTRRGDAIYLANVMKKRGASWRGLYSACQEHVGE